MTKASPAKSASKPATPKSAAKPAVEVAAPAVGPVSFLFS